MYSLLISDSAERAVSDPCDGAATAAAGSATNTVTVSVMLATLKSIERPSGFQVWPTPLLRNISEAWNGDSRA